MNKEKLSQTAASDGELEIIAYGERGNAAFDKAGFSFSGTEIKAEDILLVNRYVSSKLYPVDVQYAIVYKCSEMEVALYEFHRDPDYKREDFDARVEAWTTECNLTLGEDDWNAFIPVKNGYLTYAYRETHSEYFEKTASQNKVFSLGLFVAGVIFAIVGGVMLGLGKLSFGAGAVVLGMLAAIIGGYGIIKKK